MAAAIPYGLLTANHHDARQARVIVHGLDVSRRCVAADDRQGWCLLYDITSEGRIAAPPTLRLWTGPIVIEFGRR